MIHLLERWLRKARRLCRSATWGSRWLGSFRSTHPGHRGLLLIQIDGLSHLQLQRAIESGRVPFLRRLLHTEAYSLEPIYSGLPSTTPAFQGEFFYDVRCAVPAFQFRTPDGLADMLSPELAKSVENDLTARGGEPLLSGGSSWSNIYSGGAAPDEAHFSPACCSWRDLIAIRPWRGLLGMILFDGALLLRVPLLLLGELCAALVNVIARIRAGEPAVHELKFVLSRLFVGVGLRETVAAGAAIDLARGVPVIHINFLSYDEKGHHAGPSSRLAHGALRTIDRRIRRLYRQAHRSPVRDYEVWVLADHGQEDVRSWFEERGPIEDLCKEALKRFTHESEPRFEVAASGPVGHLYLSRSLEPDTRYAMARWLVLEGHVPGVLIRTEHDTPLWIHRHGQVKLHLHYLQEDPDRVPSDPALCNPTLQDLRGILEHRSAGELVLLGWQPDGDAWTFSFERGAHGGPGPQETRGFVLAPAGTRFPHSHGVSIRPSDLRRAALHVLKRQPLSRDVQVRRPETRAIRVITYNIHSCIGMDGRISPGRIAQILSRYDPDVVALQEVDSGLERTGSEDQARIIADELGFEFAFCPTVTSPGGAYGHALLSRFPIEVTCSARLPSAGRRRNEPRAAMLASFEIASRRVSVLNTHFGLGWLERAAQAAEILTHNWLGRVPESEPLIVCGDFNMRPHSTPYRALTRRLVDSQLVCDSWRAASTFPSRFPIARIDHVFVSRHFKVLGVQVPKSELTAVASDHLPILANLELLEEPEDQRPVPAEDPADQAAFANSGQSHAAPDASRRKSVECSVVQQQNLSIG